MIPQEVINQIKERADIAEVVSDYLSLTRTGQNLKGLCPFHAEKTPSFTVSQSRQIFHCFGCGAGGNVFTFLMRQEGLAFPEAVRELGRRTGIPVPTFQDPAQSESAAVRKRLELLNESAGAWFARNLVDSQVGREASAYLRAREIRQETIEAFGLGFAPLGWDGLLRSLSREGFTPAELALGGVAVPKDQSARPSQGVAGYYDRFRARIIFPIRDLRKRVIGFGGRVLDDGMPKYLNSPETPLFSKGRSLYGLEQAREAASHLDTLVIVEGYFDVIALHQAGIKDVAGTLGTALTQDHVRMIRRFVTKVVLLFDPDAAGVRAALRTLDLFVDSGIGVKVVSLPQGDDPDTFVKKRGAEAFHECQAHAPGLLDFAVEHSLQRAVSGTIEDRIRSVDEVLRILQKASHRLEKEEYLRRVAERLGISQQRLIERYPELLPPQPRGRTAAPIPASSDTRFKGIPEERDLVHLLLQGYLSAADLRTLPVESFSSPSCRRIVEIGLRHVDQENQAMVRRTLDDALADPECGPVATELLLSDRHYEDISAHVRGCLATLEKKRQASALSELIVKLRLAEREGHTEEARRLNVEINELRLRKAGSAPTELQPASHPSGL